MTIPFEGFQTGLMTGAHLGQRAYQAGNRRKVGRLVASGDYAGAANEAYGQGDLDTGATLTAYGTKQETTARNRQIGGFVADGDFAQASSLAGQAGDLDSLAQIKEWEQTASEEEKAAAAERSGHLSAVYVGLRDLPPEARMSEAQRIAPMFGLDPSIITPEFLSDAALDAALADAMGVREYLTHERLSAPQAPTGYRWAEDGVSLQAIRGGPADTSVVASRAAASRVPPRARSSGGGSRSGGGSSRQSAPAASGRPWERFSR